jgi:glycerophosphoryl diester phosphodiesterase
MWELDVCTTADGELILLHDQTLDRTSNVTALFPERWPWRVFHYTFSEIRRLDFGSWFESDRNSTGIQTNGRRYGGEPAPTLQEALAFTRDQQWRVNVEIKDLRGTPCKMAGVEKVVAMIEAMQMVDNVLISSFNHTYLKLVKAINPKIATGVLVHRVVHNPIPILRRLDAQAYHPHLSTIRLENIAYLRQQGFEVNVWTVNEVETALKLKQAGATGIFTDFPQILISKVEG